MILESDRMRHFNSAVFYEMSEIVKSMRALGKPVLDLGIGSPDLPPSAALVKSMQSELDSPDIFGYQNTEGIESFRNAIAEFIKKRYLVNVNPDSEVLVTMGAQDALAHISLAFINPGDIVLIPDPGYPIYEVSVHIAGGIPYPIPLLEENGFLPDLEAIPATVLKKAKLILLNFPSNPVASVADLSFFHHLVEFATKNNLLVVHDAAYIELVFDGYIAPSFLSVPGAIEVGIELHSFSKTFNFAGPRLAFAAGNKDILAVLRKLKSQIDYGVFTVVQKAGIKALTESENFIENNRKKYQTRRDALLAPLMKAGWPVQIPLATMFVWLKIPSHTDSRTFASNLLLNTGIMTVPGVGFGQCGEGFIRIALVKPPEKLEMAGNLIISQFLQ